MLSPKFVVFYCYGSNSFAHHYNIDYPVNSKINLTASWGVNGVFY